MQNEKNTEILNDLVKINNDRMEGYAKAISETKPEDADLKIIFEKMKIGSFKNRQELLNLVYGFHQDPAEGTRTDGKIYRAWMGVKAAFSGNSRKSVLESCEFGEDAARSAYYEALSSNGGLTPDVKQVVSQQLQALQASHDEIKKLRDSEK